VEVTRVLLAAVFCALSAGTMLAQPAEPQTGPLVFVCEHGSVKSVVAAALFNRLAAERGLSIRAISRGTDPDAGIPQVVRDGMTAEGLTVDQRFTPTRFSASDIRTAPRVIVFDVPMPSGNHIERWDGLPAFSNGYSAASLAIRQRVEQLIRAMAER
jgi:arsenate reductase (thioredoxin)